MTTPIRKTVTVPLRPEDAFDLFARRLPDWWPSDRHSRSAKAGKTPRAVKVTPGTGGGITETLPDGSQTDWARIVAWLPGQRLTMKWYPDRPEDEASDVEVTFTPVDTGTRIDLVHRFGDDVAQGWDSGLHRFRDRAAALVFA
jgi:uncharacterized protein YndB with AHSA1/START domain